MNTAPLTAIETKTCSRCGGSGKYSYCQMYGDRCFQCSGAGKVRTKRGEATLIYINSLRMKPVSEAVVGDVFWYEGLPNFEAAGWVTIQTITQSDYGYHLNTSRGIFNKSATCQLRVKQDKENAARTFAMGMAYQATLKADGTPYKRLAKTA